MSVSIISSPTLNTRNDALRAPDVQSEATADREIRPQDMSLDTAAPALMKMDIATASKATRKFTSFPKLPVELRIIIWQFALPGRRYVTIHQVPSMLHFHDPRIWYPTCADRAPVPLFVCHEARQEVLKRYKPLKGNKPGSGGVWMDPKKDVLCLLRTNFRTGGMAVFVDGLSDDFRSNLTFIAADDVTAGYIGIASQEIPFVDSLRRFPALETLTIVDFNDLASDNDHGISEIVAWKSLFLNDKKKVFEKNVAIVKARSPQWVEPKMEPGRIIYTKL